MPTVIYRIRSEANADGFCHIERFCNTQQHSMIGYVSPAQFEQQAQLT